LTYRKLAQLDLEMHRLFGFFTTTEFLFATRYKSIIEQVEWNDTYFAAYLDTLGQVLTQDFDDAIDDGGVSSASHTPPKRSSLSTPRHARRRSSLSVGADEPLAGASLASPVITPGDVLVPPSPSRRTSLFGAGRKSVSLEEEKQK